jgi:TetR/AcrR family transcriptional repressor of nem operon
VKGAIDRLLRALPDKRRGQKKARAGAMLALSASVGAVVLARAVDDAALGDEILAATRQGLAD